MCHSLCPFESDFSKSHIVEKKSYCREGMGKEKKRKAHGDIFVHTDQ
jgi:hypothetical protein